jgi:cytochrome c biogenesis protein CcmG/thiol:disulfide interchange protein DsbE
MRDTARLAYAGAAVLLLLVAGGTLVRGLNATAGTGQTVTGPPTVTRSEPAPRLAGPTLDGGRLDLADLRGRPVLVNMWASWCDPCRAELPLLGRALQRWAADGLAVIAVDVRDDPGAARNLLAELNLPDLPVIEDRTGAIAVSWGVVGMPETFLVDRDGIIRTWVRGSVNAAWLEEHVGALVIR